MFYSPSTLLLAASLVIIVPSIVSAADAPPKFDVDKSCRASFAADKGAMKQSLDGCLADEKGAGEEIGRDWAKYPARDRDHCEKLATLGGTGSYVEMLTCLQIARDTKTLPANIRKSGLPK